MRPVSLQLSTLLAGLFLTAFVCPASILAAEPLLAQPAVNRVGLTRGWFAQAPLQLDRYRIVNVEYHSGELFVLTEGGKVACYDGKTGKVNWTIQVGDPRHPYLPLGVGDTAVAVVNGTQLYVIGRKDVKVIDSSTDVSAEKSTATRKAAADLIRYKIVPQIGKLLFQTRVEHVPNAQPAVTDEAVFVSNPSGTIDRYDLGHEKEPRYLGSIQADGNLESPPVVTNLGLAWLSSHGTVGLTTPSGDKVHYTQRSHGSGKFSPAVWGNTLFAITEQGIITAFSTIKGEPTWSNSIGVAPRQSPIAINKSLYVVTVDDRLFRLSTVDGAEIWQVPGIRELLTVTPEKIYAVDQAQRLVILQHETGSQLAAYPLPFFEHKVANRHSDQLFLVTDRGLIQEFHETAAKARQNYMVPKEVAAVEAKEKPKPRVTQPPEGDNPPAAPGTDPFGDAPKPKPEPLPKPDALAADPFDDAPAVDKPPAPAPKDEPADPFGDDKMPAKPPADAPKSDDPFDK